MLFSGGAPILQAFLEKYKGNRKERNAETRQNRIMDVEQLELSLLILQCNDQDTLVEQS